MESHDFLIQIVLILVTARIFGDIAARLQIPSVIGELLAGMLLGPSLLNYIHPTPPIQLLAQIGIILLLFEVGLETDVGRLVRAGIKSTSVAIVGVVFPLLAGFVLSYYYFGFSMLASLFVGCTLTATSIGITLRVLSDLKQQQTAEAQVILGAAVLDDIIGIILLSLLFEFSSGGGINLWNVGKVVLFIGIFFLIAPIAAKLISGVIKRWDSISDVQGLLPTMIVSLILFFAWITNQLGAPELLGGFAAGVALSRQFFLPFAAMLHDSQEFNHKIHEQMKPIVHLFTPIFFVSIGLSLNLREIDWGSSFIWTLSIGLLIVAVITKLAAGFVLFKDSLYSKALIGTAMIPRGEVGLIFGEVGLDTGVFNNEIYAAVIIVIAATTLFPPFVLRWLCKKPVA